MKFSESFTAAEASSLVTIVTLNVDKTGNSRCRPLRFTALFERMVNCNINPIFIEFAGQGWWATCCGLPQSWDIYPLTRDERVFNRPAVPEFGTSKTHVEDFLELYIYFTGPPKGNKS